MWLDIFYFVSDAIFYCSIIMIVMILISFAFTSAINRKESTMIRNVDLNKAVAEINGVREQLAKTEQEKMMFREALDREAKNHVKIVDSLNKRIHELRSEISRNEDELMEKFQLASDATINSADMAKRVMKSEKSAAEMRKRISDERKKLYDALRKPDLDSVKINELLEETALEMYKISDEELWGDMI